MKRTTLLTAALAIAVIATATPAFAMRDPGAGGGMAMYNYGPQPPRIGQAGLNNQYADGMNLYEYVRSRPTAALDPMGTKCCLKSVEFRYTHDPRLTRWENPNPNAPSSFPAPNGQFRVFLWRLQQRIEIKAFVTADSDPKDCVMRQKARTLRYEVTTKGTRVPGIKMPGETEYKPDWPIKDGKPQVNTDWDLVKYGPDWVMWWDEPGLQFMSEVDLNKVQQYDFFVWHDFETTIYDKSANRAARWWGDWTTIIGGELHIKWQKAVKEDYWGLTALFESKSYEKPPVPTKEVLIRR